MPLFQSTPCPVLPIQSSCPVLSCPEHFLLLINKCFFTLSHSWPNVQPALFRHTTCMQVLGMSPAFVTWHRLQTLSSVTNSSSRCSAALVPFPSVDTSPAGTASLALLRDGSWRCCQPASALRGGLPGEAGARLPAGHICGGPGGCFGPHLQALGSSSGGMVLCWEGGARADPPAQFGGCGGPMHSSAMLRQCCRCQGRCGTQRGCSHRSPLTAALPTECDALWRLQAGGWAPARLLPKHAPLDRCRGTGWPRARRPFGRIAAVQRGGGPLGAGRGLRVVSRQKSAVLKADVDCWMNSA